MSRSLQSIIEVLHRSELNEAAEEARKTLPDPVSEAELARFAQEHGLSVELLMNRMGGSP